MRCVDVGLNDYHHNRGEYLHICIQTHPSHTLALARSTLTNSTDPSTTAKSDPNSRLVGRKHRPTTGPCVGAVITPRLAASTHWNDMCLSDGFRRGKSSHQREMRHGQAALLLIELSSRDLGYTAPAVTPSQIRHASQLGPYFRIRLRVMRWCGADSVRK